MSIIEKYEAYSMLSTRKRIDGMSAETKRVLRIYLKDFMGKYDEVSRETFTEWLLNKPLEHSTKSWIAINLTKFFLWNDYMDGKDCDIIRRSFRPTVKSWSDKSITDQQIGMILNAAWQSSEHILTRRRNMAIIMLFATIGCRIGQACALNLEDIDLEEDGVIKINVVKQKEVRHSARKNYEIKIVPASYTISKFNIESVISNYSDVRDKYVGLRYPDSPYFINREGSRITANYVQQYIKKIGEYVGIDITPHTFRHYVISRVAKISLTKAAILAGHSNISTTQKYVNPETQDLSDIW